VPQALALHLKERGSMDLCQQFYFRALNGSLTTRLPRARAAMMAFATACLSLSSALFADDQIGEHWVAAWGASPSVIPESITLNNQTVRQFVPIDLGGRGQRLRVHLSNELAAAEVLVGAAHIAIGQLGWVDCAELGPDVNIQRQPLLRHYGRRATGERSGQLRSGRPPS
jgi:hypothetical protein